MHDCSPRTGGRPRGVTPAGGPHTVLSSLKMRKWGRRELQTFAWGPTAGMGWSRVPEAGLPNPDPLAAPSGASADAKAGA